MKLILHRRYFNNNYTIGKLYVSKNDNLKYICDTIEDKVRNINDEGKVYGETAIPFGIYKIDMNTVSPKYSNYNKYPKYKKYNAKLPRLVDVPHFSGILIHIGNSAKDSSGCILVGENKKKGMVINSTKTFYRLMDEYLIPAYKQGEEITITIV